jgi:hypothetical protein
VPNSGEIDLHQVTDAGIAKWTLVLVGAKLHGTIATADGMGARLEHGLDLREVANHAGGFITGLLFDCHIGTSTEHRVEHSFEAEKVR